MKSPGQLPLLAGANVLKCASARHWQPRRIHLALARRPAQARRRGTAGRGGPSQLRGTWSDQTWHPARRLDEWGPACRSLPLERSLSGPRRSDEGDQGGTRRRHGFRCIAREHMAAVGIVLRIKAEMAAKRPAACLSAHTGWDRGGGANSSRQGRRTTGCLAERWDTFLKVPHATCLALERVQVRQSAKSFCSSNELHRSRTAIATRWPR
jgi:hypothetical protein